MDPLIASQPLDTDPQEKEIKQKLAKEVASGEFAKVILPELQKMQTSFFELALHNPDNNRKIMEEYRKLIPKLRESSNTKIISGLEYLDELKPDESVIISTNHLGIIKLTPVENPNHKYPIALDKFEPFLLRHAPFSAISEKLKATLHETAVQLPPPLSKIQKACGVITIIPGTEGGTETIIQEVDSIQKNEGRIIVVMYPEGGTSGKRNNAGPYDLDNFHTGTFVIAAKTGLVVLPVTQFFNPSSGYELTILPPIRLNSDDLGDIKTITENTKSAMQESLNKIKPSE